MNNKEININEIKNKLYKKFLEGLKKTTSIFYLKIIGDIEFDYIFDPENANFYLL